MKAKSQVELTCETDDTSSQVIWMLRGEAVSPLNQLDVTISADTRTLTINRFMTVKTQGGINHSGPWQCISNNLLSTSLMLTKASKLSPQIVVARSPAHDRVFIN